MNRFAYVYTMVALALLIFGADTAPVIAQGSIALEVEKTSATVKPYEYGSFDVVVRNTTKNSVDLYIVRTANELPTNEWESVVCTELLCYDAEASNYGPVTIEANSQTLVNLKIATGKEEGSARVVLSFSSGAFGEAPIVKEFLVDADQSASSVDLFPAGAVTLPYPNPAVDNTILPIPNASWIDAHVSLHDALGRLIPTETLSADAQGIRIDVRALQPGVYFYTMNDGGREINGSFTVVR